MGLAQEIADRWVDLRSPAEVESAINDLNRAEDRGDAHLLTWAKRYARALANAALEATAEREALDDEEQKASDELEGLVDRVRDWEGDLEATLTKMAASDDTEEESSIARAFLEGLADKITEAMK